MRKFRIAFSFLLFFCAFSVFAQNAWYYDKPIKKIEFEGLSSSKKSDVTAVTDQFLGRKFTDELYMDLVTKIYALDMFDPNILADALPFDENQSGVIIKFTVKELPVITTIKISGNKQIKNTEIKEVIKIKELDVFNENRIPSDERAIRDLYLDKGFTNVRVSSSTQIKDNGDVELSFLITEGTPTVVTDIRFEGNQVVSSKTLLGKLSQKVQGAFNKGYFQESNIEKDRQTILSFYRMRGYIDSSVSESVKRDVSYNAEKEREEIILTYYITEGDCYTYNGLEISGNAIFDTKTLLECVKLVKGDVFNQYKFEEGLRAIVDMYYENGYTFNNFIPQMNADPVKKEVGYKLQIIENDRAHIENIIIKGNDKTREYVITREIPMESGDIFSKAKLMTGLRNLNNLQFFSGVYPQIVQGSEENLVDLILNVEEQSTTSIEFGLTFSGVTETSDIPISLFAKWQDSNVSGTGLTLSSQLTVANTEQSVGLGYTDSWFLDKPITLSLNASFYHRDLTTLQYMYFPGNTNESYYYMDYTNWTTSVSASLGRRWTPDFAILTLTGGVSFNLLNNVYDPLIYTPIDTTISDDNNDWGWTNTIWSAFSMDDRNVNYDPSKGWFISERLGWTGLIPVLEDQFFLRSDTKLELYAPLADVQVSEKWSFKLVLMGYSDFSFQVPVPGTTIGSSSKLYIDGMFNGRGWSSITSTKGQAMWSNIVELRWPFLPGIAALDFFFDAVALKDTIEDLPSLCLDDFRFSFGPGLRICMPQFPLRFMFANTFRFVDGQFQWRENDKPDWNFVLSFNLVNK